MTERQSIIVIFDFNLAVKSLVACVFIYVTSPTIKLELHRLVISCSAGIFLFEKSTTLPNNSGRSTSNCEYC